MACVTKRDPEVEKAFWNEAKAHLAAGVEPEEVISQIAKKHGIGTDAVGSILAHNKQLFQLTNEAWAKQAKLSQLKSAAKSEVSYADKPGWYKALNRPISSRIPVSRNPYTATRQLLTIGHGGVIPFTHARNSLFIPGEAKIFGNTVRRAYSYVTPEGGSARWRADMATMRADPKFNFAVRAGLDIKLQSKPVGMGMSRWTRQSFDAIKPMRLELFKKYWNQLPDKSFEAAQDLAKRINHTTGVVNTPPVVSKVGGVTMFAPKLKFAKYASGISDPLMSGFAAKRFAKLAAINLGLLGINDLVNRYILQSKDQVNWTDPTRGDWLRMKVAGMTIPMAPMFETARLPFAAGAVLMNPNKDNKAKVLTKELASAAHPGINAIYGAVTGTDLAMGTKLPFRGVSQYLYGDHRDQQRVFGKWVNNKYAKSENAGEYAAGYLPIPLQPVLKEMAKEGVPPDLSEKFLRAYAESIMSGFTGTHTYPDVPYKNNP